MSNLDREYLQRRREESLARAEQAADPAIAHIHRRFAETYASRLEGDVSNKMQVSAS